jgi:cysteine sulfinate desulfinase/cysteine desulfurase-like protein
MGYDEKISHSALRISLSHYNTEEEIDSINEKLPAIVAEVRRRKPLPIA